MTTVPMPNVPMPNRGNLKIVPQGEREIVITRSFSAPRQLVWDAHTKPELVRRWLLGPPGWTMPVCEIDLRVGGRYRYVWNKTTGVKMEMGGVHREIGPPEKLVATQVFDDDWTKGEAVGTLVLTEQDGTMLLTNTVQYSSREARDGVMKTPMEQGMAAGYNNLDQLLGEMGISGPNK
jgi:uncharacterized protein YndB with AHSA1/START domain